jgi:hypothetical protein
MRGLSTTALRAFGRDDTSLEITQTSSKEVALEKLAPVFIKEVPGSR